ncbi:MAG TPA: SDR family oxidoreductase [Candidatus Dormibacteraeota bacterium]|nr:SDR family oxidoreductase [Candidatus Dormibacteraeota bacterium]
MGEISGRHALVTGGASGIGRLMALKLAAGGARVTIWDINATALQATVDELAAVPGSHARGFLCDVADRAQVYARAAETAAAGGPVDILINNAGVVSGKDFLELPDEKIAATFDVNVLALFWTSKAFLPAMIARGSGHIITIASASGLIGVARLADYAASKWAATGFDESLRAELRKIAPGVLTTVVCPFYINTGMFRGVHSRFPWLLPILEEEDVAERVVRAIRRGQRRLVMPWPVHLIPLLRVLPVGLFDWLANFLGVNSSMDEFIGRGGARP